MMTDDQIEEGNKLITEFDEMQGSFSEYYTQWDWLMPVVEKIEKIHNEYHGYFGVHISSNSCTIQGTRLNTSVENPHYAYFNEKISETKIEATWLAVVEFILWYTTQLQTSTP